MLLVALLLVKFVITTSNSWLSQKVNVLITSYFIISIVMSFYEGKRKRDCFTSNLNTINNLRLVKYVKFPITNKDLCFSI